MTISIEQHIEELRAELRNAVDRNERLQIGEELAQAYAALKAANTEQEAGFDVEPPH